MPSSIDLKEAREQFIQAWGAFGSAWGINRSMAQVHALLLIAHEPLSTEDVMEQLNISRGNANMNLRTLIDWGLVQKVLKSGERREFFSAEKDVWQIATRITKERKKRELEPLVKLLNELEDIPGSTPEAKSFRKMTHDLHDLTTRLDKLLEHSTRRDVQWFVKAATTLLK
jgi:DNA-binding transcriptional regulator GbsR (MarR family)